MANAILEKQERRMWDDMRRNWAYIDKIYVTVDEFDRLKRVRLNEDALSPVLEALFHPEKRMFLDDIAFIVSADDDLKRIIWLKYLRDDAASLTVFDGDGRLFGKSFIRINGDDVNAGPDPSNPIGTRYFERYALEYLQEEPVYSWNAKKRMKEVEQAVISRMFPRMEEIVYFIMAAIHHVLNTVEVREVAATAEPVKLDESRGSRSSSRVPAFRPPRKLHRIIYEGKRPAGRRQRSGTYIQRVESWKVRGHWRTYANGKRVWVKPHVKGRKSEKYRPLGAEYRL